MGEEFKEDYKHMASLEDLKKFQLIDAGEWLGVAGVAEAKNNEDRIALLIQDGVDYDLYIEERTARKLDKNHEPIVEGAPEEDEEVSSAPTATILPVNPPVPAPVEESEILIKMERKNRSFEHRGAKLYKFSKDHPYQLVSPQDEQILINMGGFRTATQNEVKDFYS